MDGIYSDLVGLRKQLISDNVIAIDIEKNIKSAFIHLEQRASMTLTRRVTGFSPVFFVETQPQGHVRLTDSSTQTTGHKKMDETPENQLANERGE